MQVFSSRRFFVGLVATWNVLLPGVREQIVHGLFTEISPFAWIPADRSSVVLPSNFPGAGLANFVLGSNGIRSIVFGR
jgi:hypothetical protein